MAQHHDGILIIDFGSQYTQLIARRVREAHVYCEIHPPSRTVQWIRNWKPKGIILSGGPSSVYDEDVPTADRVAGHHRDDRLRQAPHLDVQVGHVEAPGRRSARSGAGRAGRPCSSPA